MLKIKDNVDLKELEKFGFEREYLIDSWSWVLKYKKGEFYEEFIDIWEKDRNIQCCAIGLLDVLFDLIEAGLVEKVGDNQ